MGEPSATDIVTQPGFSLATGEVPHPAVTSDFSLRYTGLITAPVDGEVEFEVTSDDGVRVWMDGSLVHDHWQGQGATATSFTYAMTAEEPVPFVLEYFDDHLGGVLELSWNLGQGLESIPADAYLPKVIEVGIAQAPLQPIPESGIALRGPSSGTVSPAYVELAVASVDELNAWGGWPLRPVQIESIDGRRFYLNLDLHPVLPTPLVVVNGDEMQVRWLRWEISDPSGPGQVLRVGDSVLLHPHAGRFGTAYGASVERRRRWGRAVVTFDQPGDYRIGGGDAWFTAVSAELPRIASEIGFAKLVDVQIGPRADEVVITSNDHAGLVLAHREAIDGGVRFTVMPTRFGTGRVLVRLPGQLQPVIAAVEVDEFTIRSDLEDRVTGRKDANGHMIVPFGFTMKPVVPYTTIDIEMLSSVATIDGQSFLSIPAEELDGAGRWEATMVVSKGSLNYTTCHRLRVRQDEE